MPIMNNWSFDGKAESLLRQLVGVEAPSGDEIRMGGFLRNLLETMPGVTVSTDVLGNVYASYDAGGTVSLGLVAHIDSVGIQITRVDSDGMCRFRMVGGVLPHVLLGQRVKILTRSGIVDGVIGFDQTSQFGQPKGLVDSDLWIDTLSAAGSSVRAGDFAVMEPQVKADGNLLSGTSLDDRIGVLSLLEILRLVNEHRLPVNLHCIFSAQEEIALRGASIIGANCDMDACIVVDVDYATDTPLSHSEQMGCLVLGHGAGLTRKVDNNPVLFRIFSDVAEKEEIPYQVNVGRYICRGTDAAVLQTAGKGVATLNVSVPCRYMHSPVEVCSIKDVESVISLIYSAIRRMAEAGCRSFIPGID